MSRASLPAVMLTPTTAGESVTPTTALSIGDVFACVRALADAAASLPLIAYRHTADGGRERWDGALAGLLRRPAPGVTQAGLVGQLVAHLNLFGNAYVAKGRNADGEVEALWLLAPERVVPRVLGGLPFWDYTDGQGRPVTLTQQDVIHVRGLSVDGLVGLSPVRQAREALGLASALATHASAFMANGAAPSGLLRVGAGVSPSERAAATEQAEALKKAWRERHGGPSNAGRVAVTLGDIEFVPLSMPLADAQFLEQRKLSSTEVARIFRVPPWLIGAESGSSMTYSNAETQAIAFQTYALRPWLVAIEQALAADADLCPEGVYVEFLMDAMLRADSATRAGVYAQGLAGGWLTINEVRQRENLPPLTGAALAAAEARAARSPAPAPERQEVAA